MEWISVKDRLPETKGTYLVYAPTYSGGSSSSLDCINGVMFSRWGKHWSIEVGYHKRPNCVKYWMPLPEPPTDIPSFEEREAQSEGCNMCKEMDFVDIWDGDFLLKAGYPSFCPECGRPLKKDE